MEPTLARIIPWTLGGVIVAGVGLRLGVSVLAALRRAGLDQRQRQLQVELLRQRLEAARAAAARSASEGAAWGGVRKFAVQRKEIENAWGDICSLYLVPHDRKGLPAFRPGQYLTFHLKVPGEAREVVRCYSLSDRPGTDYYRVTVKRLARAASETGREVPLASSFLHDEVRVGDLLDVEAPKGSFFLDTDRETPVVLLGGGIGVTPLVSMLQYIIATGSTRETWLFYAVRNGTEHAMKESLALVARESDKVHVVVCYSEPRPVEDVQGRDYQHEGPLTVDVVRDLLPSNNYDFYISAPPRVTRELSEGLHAWGVPEEHVRFETYGPETVKEMAHAEPAEAPGAEIQVTFARADKTFPWSPEAGSLLEFAEANGVDMTYGCRAGQCGMCETAVKSGEVEYLRDPGARASDGCCLPCVSVPKGDLVLDA